MRTANDHGCKCTYRRLVIAKIKRRSHGQYRRRQHGQMALGFVDYSIMLIKLFFRISFNYDKRLKRESRGNYISIKLILKIILKHVNFSNILIDKIKFAARCNIRSRMRLRIGDRESFSQLSRCANVYAGWIRRIL